MRHHPQGIFRCIALVCLFAGLAGCAVMDKSECAHANWHEIGKVDGLAGNPMFSVREKACAKHGLGADQSSYERGVQAGLSGFCTAASGRIHGAKGGTYRRGLCPAATESDFLAGYAPAYEKFKFQKKIRELQSQISEKEQLLGQELGKIGKPDVEGLRQEIKRLKKELQTEMYLRILD